MRTNDRNGSAFDQSEQDQLRAEFFDAETQAEVDYLVHVDWDDGPVIPNPYHHSDPRRRWFYEAVQRELSRTNGDSIDWW